MNLSFDEFSDLAKQYNLIPLSRELPGDLETPVSAFLKIRSGDYDFLLESVEGGERWGRYSFIGTHPRSVVVFQNGELKIYDPKRRIFESAKDTKDPFDYFRRQWEGLKPLLDRNLPRFYGGWVGFMSYHAVTHFEKISLFHPNPNHTPELCFMATDTLLIFDNLKHSICIVHPVFIPNPVTSSELKHLYDEARRQIESTAFQLQKPLPMGGAWSEPHLTAQEILPEISREEFIRRVQRAKDYIAAGDIFQVVLSNRFSIPWQGRDSFWAYRKLRKINPSPYMYYLGFRDLTIVGSSPEILARIEGSRMTVRPIAGTRRRGKTVEEDIKLRQELLADEKERAEHLMLLDLGRNDVGRVCQPGSVKVDWNYHVEFYSHVMHLVSQVSGELLAGNTALDAVAAAFPAGTLTGAPKIRAMEIIDELESFARGIYGGAVGYLGYSGDTDLAIAIRTAVMHEDVATIQAGAGIVHDSDPGHEYEECANKAGALIKALT